MSPSRFSPLPSSESRKRLSIFGFVVLLLSGPSSSNDFDKRLDSFVQASCIGCHDSDTETRLDFTTLDHDLGDEETFRKWVGVFDRVDRGEMPPPDDEPLDAKVRSDLLSELKTELVRVNRHRQETYGRVPSRRLSRQEYEHTLHDLLGIHTDLAKHLPPESESGAFDVVAASQEMSSVHVRSLLRAADLALDEAIQVGKRPSMKERDIDYFHSPYIQMWVDRPVRRGGGTIFKTDKDVVTFRGENFVFRSDANGFKPPVAGLYRIKVNAAAYQQRSSITVSLKRQNDVQGESELFAAWDLDGEDYREVSTVTYLRPDDYFYVSADELEPAPDGGIIYTSQPASSFRGEGVKIRRVTVEGPLESTWPPERTQKLFPGVQWDALSVLVVFFGAKQGYEPVLTQSPIDHIRASISELAPKAFRRPLSEEEVDAFAALAMPSLDAGRGLVSSARIPLRSILVSPELVFQTGEPGKLDGPALASRLSYFLWRSLPDETLRTIAAEGTLTNPKVLAEQVDRMLEDPKSDRFVNEFLDQWLELDHIDATTPDAFLYPEYDDVLRRAMLAETREFFTHLIEADLSVQNLIDSDFTFLNRRLAEHYGIEGVDGESMRKVTLHEDSVRGGILSHASIAKVTANGTVTTPVKRGNFVLTNLLGLPTNPPPPSAGSIEPDTRGATTIRETLQKHQSVAACAACHRRIDPPGFALECFDPVGNYRDRYRNSRGIQRELVNGLRFLHKEYDLGLPVDCSGVTEDGIEFGDLRGYKRQLCGSTEQVARNLLTKLIAFSTGGEVEFADRDEVERILDELRGDGFPLRRMIHQVVASRLFINR